MVDEHAELSGWLRTEGEALSDLLYSVIGRCGDSGAKPLLVALRRAVFQSKAPGDRAWSERVRRVLPADLAARIAVWVSELDRAKALEVRLPEVLAAKRSVRTDTLGEAVAKRAFRFGLLLGSSTLADALGEWIDEPSAGPLRGPVLVRLAKYLSRAVAKTSPYASFTCRAAFATNLSLRPAAVPYAIDYPRAEGDTDAATQVSIAELQVSYDPVRDRLVLCGRVGGPRPTEFAAARVWRWDASC